MRRIIYASFQRFFKKLAITSIAHPQFEKMLAFQYLLKLAQIIRVKYGPLTFSKDRGYYLVFQMILVYQNWRLEVFRNLHGLSFLLHAN